MNNVVRVQDDFGIIEVKGIGLITVREWSMIVDDVISRISRSGVSSVKLKHAWDKWNSILYLVTTDEDTAKAITSSPKLLW